MSRLTQPRPVIDHWLGSVGEPESGVGLIARMFILILGTVLGLTHLYVWKRLVKDTTEPGRTRWILTAVLLGAAPPAGDATLVLPRVTGLDRAGVVRLAGLPLVRRWSRTCSWRLLVLEPVRLALRGWVSAEGARRARGRARPRPRLAAAVNRRVFLARTSAAAAGAASVGLVGVGAATALGPPDVLQVPVRLRRLDPAFNGFRIAVVSDIHLGPLSGGAHRADRPDDQRDRRRSGGHRRRPGGRHRSEKLGPCRRTIAGLGVPRGTLLRHR